MSAFFFILTRGGGVASAREVCCQSMLRVTSLASVGNAQRARGNADMDGPRRHRARNGRQLLRRSESEKERETACEQPLQEAAAARLLTCVSEHCARPRHTPAFSTSSWPTCTLSNISLRVDPATNGFVARARAAPRTAIVAAAAPTSWNANADNLRHQTRSQASGSRMMISQHSLGDDITALSRI